MEDSQKIRAKLNELNKTPLGNLLNTKQEWQAVGGYFSFIGFTPNPTGQGGTFNTSYGYIVKIFVNVKTGEMKIYPYQLFEKL